MPPSVCSDSCLNFASDGDCDDGGPGAEYFKCALGTDCTDCGTTPTSIIPPPAYSARPPPAYPPLISDAGWFSDWTYWALAILMISALPVLYRYCNRTRTSQRLVEVGNINQSDEIGLQESTRIGRVDTHYTSSPELPKLSSATLHDSYTTAADVPAVTTQMSNEVQRGLQALMGQPWPDWFPRVCVSYATGTRPDLDAHGTGPGMMHAAAITRALYQAGVACASGLCVPAGQNWKEFLPKINSRFAKCEVLIVLLSPAFYLSRPCLLEIDKAMAAKKMKLVPLRCAEPLPNKKAQWPDISAEDALMLEQVQAKLTVINSLPPRGLFFEDPANLEDLIVRVHDLLHGSVGQLPPTGRESKNNHVDSSVAV